MRSWRHDTFINIHALYCSSIFMLSTANQYPCSLLLINIHALYCESIFMLSTANQYSCSLLLINIHALYCSSIFMLSTANTCGLMSRTLLHWWHLLCW